MDFIENNRPSWRELTTEEPLAMLGNVPVEIIFLSGDDSASQCGFPDLPRSGNEDHFLSQVFFHLVSQVARFHGAMILLFLTAVKITREFFGSLAKRQAFSSILAGSDSYREEA
jgi:hypothetical protein